MDYNTDVCIVGSGPAGAILADWLAENGHDVVVLEAGPRFDDQERQERMERELRPAFSRNDVWDGGGARDAFTISGDVDYALNDRRVKGVGGTTLHWQGSATRMHPEDFEMDTRHGIADDWPISYADLEPYYLAAEREMGVAGEAYRFAGPRSEPYPLPAHAASYTDGLFSEALEEIGIELHACPTAINSEPYDDRSECLGFGTCNPVCPSGARYSADVHVRKAEDNGATVVDQAPVQRLEHDDSDERVVEAVYEKGGERHRVSARQFVIAAGGVESARLLLLSTSDQYPDGLANSSGLVGRYFGEHPAISVTGVLDRPTRQHLIGFETGISEQYYDYDSGPEGTMLFQAANNNGLSPVEAVLDPDANMSRLLGGDLTGAADTDRWGGQLVDHVREQYGENRIGMTVQVEPLPDPDSRVALNHDAVDDHGNPVPDISLSTGDQARETLERAESVLYDVFDVLGASDVRTIGSPEEPFFTNHHMGTTRMGDDPETSVVDSNLQTHDLENLYVSSSSVFVTYGAAHPTLTIAALTLRLADHLHDTVS